MTYARPNDAVADIPSGVSPANIRHLKIVSES
jgi:hypothetical protein